ncbi:DUF4181 domain-containing protein [Falsibacillus pallidus]
MAFHMVMRKILKVEKESWFSNDYVNEGHKKIDRTIRISCLVLIFVQFIIQAEYGFFNLAWYLKIPYPVILYLIVSEITKVVMEKKYAENKNKYLVTTFQLLFNYILICTLIATRVFGWLV